MLNKQEILLVEDDSAVASWIMKRLNELENVSLIRQAKTYSQAIQFLKEFNPGKIILDLNLPDRSGTDIIKFISQEKIGTAIFVFSMNKELKNVCLRLGARAFFYKGTDAEKLIQTISLD